VEPALLPGPGSSVGQKQEHRCNAAIDVTGLVQWQLGKDGVDVLLHRTRGKRQRLGNRRVVLALRHTGQHLTLARGETAQGRADGARTFDDERLDNPGVDHRTALCHLPNCAGEMFGVGDALFQQVGPPA
jgi:hypothetical protein